MSVAYHVFNGLPWFCLPPSDTQFMAVLPGLFSGKHGISSVNFSLLVHTMSDRFSIFDVLSSLSLSLQTRR